jgi:hypothetical protein
VTDREAQQAALELAVEDDYGLWEIIWRLRTLQPDLPAASLETLARSAVLDLATQRFVDLFRMDDPVREPLSASEAETILNRAQSWLPPNEQPHEYRIAATDAGKREYYKSANSQ